MERDRRVKTFDFTKSDTPPSRAEDVQQSAYRSFEEFRRQHDRSAEDVTRRENEKTVTDALAVEIKKDMDEATLLKLKELVERARELVSEMCNAIRGQIDEANERRYKDGVYANPDWWKRVNGASRAKSWQRQRLQEKVGEINRALKMCKHEVTMGMEGARQLTRDRMFVKVAQLQLTGETFDRLWRMVDEMEKTRGQD